MNAPAAATATTRLPSTMRNPAPPKGWNVLPRLLSISGVWDHLNRWK